MAFRQLTRAFHRGSNETLVLQKPERYGHRLGSAKPKNESISHKLFATAKENSDKTTNCSSVSRIFSSRCAAADRHYMTLRALIILISDNTSPLLLLLPYFVTVRI